MTPKRRHLFLMGCYFEGGLPPPCWRRRPLVFGDGSPLREFARCSLELQSCCRVHQRQGGNLRNVPARRSSEIEEENVDD
jgi:hypothetical protein